MTLKLLLIIQMICMMFTKYDDYHPDKENKILIVFDDMIADVFHNKKLNSRVTKLFVRRRKLNISLVFITQLYSKVPKDVRLNTTHFFIAKITNKGVVRQIENHLSDISTKDFINIHRKFTFEPYSFLVNDATLSSNNPLRFRKNIFVIECNSIEVNLLERNSLECNSIV